MAWSKNRHTYFLVYLTDRMTNTIIYNTGLWRFLLLGWLWMGTLVAGLAQNDASRAYQAAPLGIERSFDAQTWKKQSKDLRYTVRSNSRVVEPKRNNTAPNTVNRPRSGMTAKEVSRFLLILLGLGVVIFILYRLVGGNAVLANRSIERRTPVRLEDIESNLHEADVESFLDKAIRQENYRLAIRLYYLAIIKKLSEKGYIHWKKEKTNGHYLREMRQNKHPETKSFRDVTRVFERVWYSTMPFDGGQFKEVRLGFNELLQTLK